MRFFFFFFGILFFFSCSSDDNTNPPDDNPVGDTITLNEKWENETPSFLPQGMVYDALDRSYFYVAAC